MYELKIMRVCRFGLDYIMDMRPGLTDRGHNLSNLQSIFCNVLPTD